MIFHEWRAEVDGAEREELRQLFTEAALEDTENGFATFDLDDPVPAGSRYLLVWLLSDERTGRALPDPTLAGCLRLEPVDDHPGRAEVRLVVHPDLRSRGIATLLYEQVGLDVQADGGWAGSGCSELCCWAVGNHPAAYRMSLRLADTGVHRGHRQWRLLAPLRRGDAEGLVGTALPDGLEAQLHRNAGEPGFDAWSKLASALDALREGGAEAGAITVADHEDALLAACRRAGFQHARTDVRYDLP